VCHNQRKATNGSMRRCGKGNQTVTLGVQQFVGQFLNDYPALLAALTLGAVPLVVLYTVFSRQFIRGLSAGYGK